MKLNPRNSLTFKSQHESIIQNINELHEQNQTIIKEYMNKQQNLQEQLQLHSTYITFQELKHALHHNIWTQKVGIFLNPLSNLNTVSIQQQQTLLKHSESKLILLERIFQTESRITQFQEQQKMIQNDIDGRTAQMDSLLIEYEELEQIIDSQQNKQQSTLIRQIIDINKQLNQLKLQYISLANQRQSRDIKQQEYQSNITQFEQQLKTLTIEQQIKALQYPQFNVDRYVQIIISKNESQFDLLTQTVLLINEKLLQYFKTKNPILLQNINQIEEQNSFKCFDSTILNQVLDDYQIQEYSQFLVLELPKRINRYKIELQLKANKTQLLEIQREMHQIIYDQSIIQCHYNRLESSLPLLDQNPTALKLQKILQRMNHIECLKSQNKTLFEVTFPSQIKAISQSIQQTQTQLNQLIKDLQYSIMIEQEFYYKINSNSPQKLPLLILEQLPPHNLELEMEENRKQYQQSQQLYNQNVENLQQRLKQLQEKQVQRRYLAEVSDSIQRKENIPPSDSRDQSLLGTIQIDMSQERTTSKYSVFRSRKQLFMNEATDRSLSSYSFLGHRASDPLLSKTKLTLKQQTTISSLASQKNPLLSPKNHHISVEQSLSLHSSARRFPELQMERSPQQGGIYKVLKRVCRTQQISTYSSKYVKLNGKMKCLEFYNSNRMLHDLGQKESALCLRQIKEMKVQKLSLELIMSKHQKIELVFSKQEQLNEFMKSISQ